MKLTLLTAACAFLISATALGAGKPVEKATAEEKKEAGDLYTQAMAAFEKDDYEPALQGFRRSYDVVKSPNSHFMIARTLARLGRNVEAYEELEAVIDESNEMGDRYASTATAAHAKEDEVRPRIGLIVVKLGEAPKGTRVLVGEDPLPKEKLGRPFAVLPGETKLSAVTPKGTRSTKSVTLDAGSSADVVLDVQDPEATPAKKAPFPERDRHRKYLLETEFHVAGEALKPPGRTTRGAGVGARLSLELLHEGFLPGFNDGFGITAGADWIITSTKQHVWIPAAAQWNFWLAPKFSLMVEPGAALLLGAGTEIAPVFALGARYKIAGRFYLVGKLGIPTSTIGVSFVE